MPVAGTNNKAEQVLRGTAEARHLGQTNKTLVGARRKTIIVSVLESLRLYLTTFTLAGISAEIERWWQAGQSCFSDLLQNLKLQPPSQTLLDPLMPVPSG